MNYDVVFIILAWTFWSLLHILSIPANDTPGEIIVWTWLWTALSVWVALMAYWLWDNPYLSCWISMFSGGMGKKFTGERGKNIMKMFERNK